MASLLLAPVRRLGRSATLLGLLLVTLLPAHAIAAPDVAPPATPKVAAACEQAAVVARATADQIIPISGIGELSGCVADTSGIDRVLVAWSSDTRAAHARICTDPEVVDGAWRCTWDTTRLPAGRYTVRLVAIDAAGNQGTFTRPYEVQAPAPSRAPDTAAPDAAAPEAAAPDTTAPETAVPDTAAPSDHDDAATNGDEAATAAPSSPLPDVQAPAFSPTQRLVLDRISLCEHGGDAATPTDSDAIVTQLDQATAVAACLEPATTQAGAVAIGLDADIPVPPTVRVTVATQQQLDELTRVVPAQVGGVPVVVHLASDAELARIAAAGLLPAA
ncbi:MAG: hypothetical protein JWN72_321 [Thermoleophilia bacterium]|nr:hypothetical protein [Thermoleophilia bacterium]